MFKSNKYKQHIIKTRFQTARARQYIDVGRSSIFVEVRTSQTTGPHQDIPDHENKKMMAEHLKYLEEAAKRDHRKIGREQDLFFFHDRSPGSCFFLPHGTIIYNTLQSFLREDYWKRGDDMFIVDVEKSKWGLKPMNCPGHCLLFGHRERSYRELPMRIADFGILHRNEASGALTGLTRVRRFQQDDTHIFCTEEQVSITRLHCLVVLTLVQIEGEILGLFDFLQTVYGNFGFTFKLKLSTRPEKYLGELETWDKAENTLRSALDNFAAQGGSKWEMNPGDGAFYGPKIDITISDALKRDFQCATIQLDFQLPQQFNLEYRTDEQAAAVKAEAAAVITDGANDSKPVESNEEAPKDGAPQEKVYRKELTPGCARPVMIHRAICGSFERFIAILTEHFAGKWPLWLSPRQILVVPVMPSANEYVLEVQKIFREKKFHCDIDISGNTMPKKIRTGQLQQYNFIFVVGAEEMKARTVNIRDRDDPATQAKGEMITLEDAIVKLEHLRSTKAIAKVPAIVV
ncbi:hypothetical protein MRB53_039387 [Persea americana]|nr:hypothetical protein MRB53_039387 [Persea americana]